MVDIITEKRPRGETVRPAVSIPNGIWTQFKYIYPNKEIRDNIISTLLSEHITVED